MEIDFFLMQGLFPLKYHRNFYLLFLRQRYIDPRNNHHAEKEALNLLSAADTNQDGVLTLLEVLNQRELFMASKMVDAARSFHDEF